MVDEVVEQPAIILKASAWCRNQNETSLICFAHNSLTPTLISRKEDILFFKEREINVQKLPNRATGFPLSSNGDPPPSSAPPRPLLLLLLPSLPPSPEPQPPPPSRRRPPLPPAAPLLRTSHRALRPDGVRSPAVDRIQLLRPASPPRTRRELRPSFGLLRAAPARPSLGCKYWRWVVSRHSS